MSALGIEGAEAECFTAKCIEKRKVCVKQYLETALVDVCGDCVSLIKSQFNLSSTSIEEGTGACLGVWQTAVLSVALGAGAVAGIVIAVIVGSVIIVAAGSVGTYELVKRVHEASSHGLVSNPLYEAKQSEGRNPFFAGAGSVSVHEGN